MTTSSSTEQAPPGTVGVLLMTFGSPRTLEDVPAYLASVRGGRENLAAYLGVHPQHVALWLGGKSGPPRSVFEKAMEIILAEHDRRAALEQARPTPKRRQSDSA